MFTNTMPNSEDFDLSFKVFHELMAKKVTDILLVSSPYEAFIMEEEGRLAERIIHEYRGLNLSRPPMLTWVSTAQEALDALATKKFDLVITMPQVDEMDAYVLGRKIKALKPDLPVYLLIQNTSKHLLERKYAGRKSIDRVFVWSGNSDLLLALIKNLEDRLNVAYDTQRARVRVIILVEDSPIYYSSLLPLLYKEIVTQTQAVMEESVNDEHRILRMRARPKILVAENFEEALELYRQYRPYLLSVFSDVRFPKSGQVDDMAGFNLLSMIRQEEPDLPLLNFSSEESNRQSAENIPAAFCYSTTALGNGRNRDICDIVFVNPDTFEPARTVDIATEIGRMNGQLVQQKRKFLLIGPGRWGSADRWLGIPVNWNDISGVGTMIETTVENFKADPSQGSHFFHNITSLGISYLTVSQNSNDFIDWKWLQSLPAAAKTTYLNHVRLDNPLTIKIDGKNSRAVILT